MRLKYFPSLILLLLLLVPAESAFAESYGSLRQDYQQLLKSAQSQRQRVNWENLIARFDTHIKNNNPGKNIDTSMFLLAKTWDGLSRASGSRSDAQQAYNAYIKMADKYPQSRLADDALYLAGQTAEHRLNNKVAAYNSYKRLIDELPASDMVAVAQQRLGKLPVPVTVKQKPVVAKSYHDNVVGKPIKLDKIRYWSGSKYTRIVLDLTAPVATKPHYLKGENPRLYFDLLYTELNSQLKKSTPIGNGLVDKIRISKFNSQRARVVIDLDRVAEYKLTTLDNPHRIVIDIMGAPSRPQITNAPSKQRDDSADDSIASILDTAADKRVIIHVPQEKHDEGIRLIVVDAGHGGRDPGAIGPHKVYEKNVVLKMAKYLASELRKQLGVKVLLTRSDDRYLKLRERTEYANRVGADLFISLHANATANGKAYGVETYFLNLSKNNQAAEVAARENGTTLQEVGNLEAILFDLMANAKINESSRLAAEVQQALVAGLRSKYSNIKDLGVKQGPFHVLLGATMPSVLVEAGFVSNRREEKRLNSSKYQKQVAAAIVKGVKNYAATIDQGHK